GLDGRYDSANGSLTCRNSGETLTSIATTIPNYPATGPVTGADLLSSPDQLGVEVPPECRSLLEEALLLDVDSADEMATLWRRQFAKDHPGAVVPDVAPVKAAFRRCILAGWKIRQPEIQGTNFEDDAKSHYEGEFPSPVAFIPWQEPWAPVF